MIYLIIAIVFALLVSWYVAYQVGWNIGVFIQRDRNDLTSGEFCKLYEGYGIWFLSNRFEVRYTDDLRTGNFSAGFLQEEHAKKFIDYLVESTNMKPRL